MYKTMTTLIVCLMALAFLAVPSGRALLEYKDEWVADEINLVLAPGASIDAVSARYGLNVLENISGSTCYRLGLPTGISVQDVLRRVVGDLEIISADPNFKLEGPEIRQLSQAFVDQLSQAFVDGVAPVSFYAQPAVLDLHLNQALAISSGAGVTVAVIDTGADLNHPVFAGRLAWPYYDFVDNDANPTDEPNGVGSGHGTFVAGLIALAAPGAKLMPLRAFGTDGRATSFNIAKAVRFAADNGADVINMSFGLIARDGLIKDALDYVYRRAYMVAAAGNDNLDFLQFPGAIDSKTLAIGATTAANLKAPFSNYNRKLTVSAPGVLLYSAYPGRRWAYWTGTSFSTALVSAEAAQLLALHPKLGRTQLNRMIGQSGVNIDSLNPAYVGKIGRRIDYLSAIGFLQENR